MEVWLPIIVDILCEELKTEKTQRQLPISKFKHKIEDMVHGKSELSL